MITSTSPGAHCLDQRLAVILCAQWRRQLQEGAIGPDIVFVERDVIDRSRGGDVQAGIFGTAQNLKRIRARDRRRVITPADQGNEADVALEHHRFRRFRNAEQAEAGGEFAFIHHAIADQIWVLGVMNDHRIEIAGVSQHAPHHLRIGDAFCAVGEGDRACRLEQADFRHLLAFEPFVIAAIGCTCTIALSRARRRT